MMSNEKESRELVQTLKFVQIEIANRKHPERNFGEKKNTYRHANTHIYITKNICTL